MIESFMPDYEHVLAKNSEYQLYIFWGLVFAVYRSLTLFKTHYKGRFESIKVDFKRAKALISFAQKPGNAKQTTLKLKNLRLEHQPRGHHEIETKGALLDIYRGREESTGYTDVYDIFNLSAYDDQGQAIMFKPGGLVLKELVIDRDHALRFDYLKFLIENSERFEGGPKMIESD